MSSDWAHPFCLSCDKQTDGATYCSESCRLAEYEKTASPAAAAPVVALASTVTTQFSWAPRPQPKSYISPAYDFGVDCQQPLPADPHRNSLVSHRGNLPATQASNSRTLTPSSSTSSLCSMKSASSSASESGQLSEKAAKELRAYASSFEQARMQRRRSY